MTLSTVRSRWLYGVFGLILMVSAHAQAQLPKVVVASVQAEAMVEEIALSGTVVAQRQAAVSVPIGGLISERRVDVGDLVSRDDVLLRLDDELARLELAGANAATREAEQRLGEARRLLEQAREVGGIRVITETEQTRRASEAAVAEAALVRARAAEALQGARVKRHQLNAPFDGIVSERLVDVGEWVSPGDPVYRLVDTTDVLIDFQVPQHAFAWLDQNARLQVMQPGKAPQPVTIARWLPLADPQARTFLLRSAPPEGMRLMPGMAVSAVLQLTRQAQAYSIPRDAINRAPDGRVSVWVVEEGEGASGFFARAQAIELIGSNGNRVFVKGDLDATARVVVRGNEALRADGEVVVVEG